MIKRYVPLIFSVFLLFSLSAIGTQNSNISAQMPQIVLVTGFEPFGAYDTNPSQLIAESLDGEELDGALIFGFVLPVDFNESVTLTTQAMEILHPVLVVSIGLDASTRVIHVEKLGLNIKHDPNDTEERRFQRLNPVGPLLRFSLLPTRKIVRALREQDIPASQSWSAGTYVCNALFYGVLDYIQMHNLSMHAGFLHVPLLSSQDPNGMNLNTMIEATKTTIRISLHEAQS